MTFPDPGFEPAVRRAYRRVERDLAAAGPTLGARLRAWGRGLRGARRPWVYLTDVRAFPLLYLPWFAEESVAGAADPAFQEDLARSSLAGYFHIRLIDDAADAGDPAALGLLPALGVLHLLFEAPYRARFPDPHPFHGELASLWGACAEATLRDGLARTIDAREYRRSSARKTGAARIPVHAVLHRHGRLDRVPAWDRFLEAYGRWHQMDDDVFDWEEDLDRGKATYFTCEAVRRAGPAGARAWVVRGGLEWGFARLDRWWTAVRRASGPLGSPGLEAYLDARAAVHARQRAAHAGSARALRDAVARAAARVLGGGDR